jgi:uncharacterized protein YdeI (BOF family)
MKKLFILGAFALCATTSFAQNADRLVDKSQQQNNQQQASQSSQTSQNSEHDALTHMEHQS